MPGVQESLVRRVEVERLEPLGRLEEQRGSITAQVPGPAIRISRRIGGLGQGLKRLLSVALHSGTGTTGDGLLTGLS
jgi:hypothetical protein